MDKRDSDKIIQLVREGKQISKVMEEDFPQYDYWDIYTAAFNAGERSSMGVKRMISNRLQKLPNASPQEQNQIITDIDDLVCYLYSRYKESQQKLDEIRTIISK